ncbi:MarR family winged helix-turn-helix transcriptional regulator [Spelaeicoccus albus]
MRYRREFDVSLGEWRVIALLGEKPGTTLNRLARRAALDKSQMSRVVARLEERGYVTRSAGARRSTMLTLTEAGLGVYDGLIGAANQRDQRLESLASPAKMRVFEEVLDALDVFARQMEAEEDTK